MSALTNEQDDMPPEMEYGIDDIPFLLAALDAAEAQRDEALLAVRADHDAYHRELTRADAAEARIGAIQKASADLLNDEMSDLEYQHLNRQYREFARRARAALRAEDHSNCLPTDCERGYHHS